MKNIIGLLGIVVLLATMAIPVSAQVPGLEYSPHMNGEGLEPEFGDLTKAQRIRLAMFHRKIGNGMVQPFRVNVRERIEERIVPQNILSEIIVGDYTLDERLSKTMDNAFAKSFANDMVRFSLEREDNNGESAALRLLEARLGLESIYHAMEEANVDRVCKELEKPSKEIDVDLILNIVSKVYPAAKDYYDKALTV